MGSGTSLEDFYPSIAINSLMRILKDLTLSQHHTMAIQALGFIFKSLGIKSVPYLPQVSERWGVGVGGGLSLDMQVYVLIWCEERWSR